MPPERKSGPIEETRTWILPAILGLVLGVLGSVGVIELRPQMLVSPQEPMQKSQPFSTPFRIDNTGYLSFNIAHAFCYIVNIDTGRIHFKNESIHFLEWDNVDLNRNEGGTILPRYLHGLMPQSADIVLVVDYAPFRHFPLGTFRKYFRFKGIYTDNWRWTRTPLAGIEDEVKRKIDSHLMVIKKMPDRAN